MKKTALMSIVLACIMSGCTREPVEVVWTAGQYNAERNATEYTFTIRNLPKKAEKEGWALYFSQMPSVIRNIPGSGYIVEPVMANWHRIIPDPDCHTADPAAGQEVTVRYSATPVRRYSLAPEGVVLAAGSGRPEPVEFRAVFPEPPDDGEQVYEENSECTVTGPEPLSLIPMPKEVTGKDGRLRLEDGIKVMPSEDYGPEAAYLAGALKDMGLSPAGDSPAEITFVTCRDVQSDEGYSIDASASGKITVSARSASGAFYGAVTLLKLLRNSGGESLGCFHINDWPDLGYRGAMIDIARNFTSQPDLKKMIGLLSQYKVNTLQFHFCDDEAWRLEIEGLPELTSVGVFHGFGDEGRYLMPGYDGCIDPNDRTSTSNGYYTRAEFVDLLKFAASRHIKVIPEIESPGHGRAAIKAMEARYAATGDSSFLLSDPQDTSEYMSAQSYTDNVMNVAMESMYTFMSKVIDELISMYSEAGLVLDCVHIGGDEVAQGSWTGSPICRKFMEENGMTSSADLKAYYVDRMTELCSARGIRISGWQEMAMHIDSRLDDRLQPHIANIFCWSTVPGLGDHVPYTLAERGYNVVLSNVNNTYADMIYRDNPEERGHDWAGILNERMAFALQPYDVYKSMRHRADGSPADLGRAHTGKPALTDTSRISGVQTQCFTETVRSFDDLTSYMFPKILGVYERGWNARPEWSRMSGQEEETAFRKDFGAFYGRVTAQEMPYWASLGIAFHLPQPGLKSEGGKLMANSTVPDAEIRYTTDGSDPDMSSPLWTSAVDIPSDCTVRARLFHLGRHSSVTRLTIRTAGQSGM